MLTTYLHQTKGSPHVRSVTPVHNRRPRPAVCPFEPFFSGDFLEARRSPRQSLFGAFVWSVGIARYRPVSIFLPWGGKLRATIGVTIQKPQNMDTHIAIPISPKTVSIYFNSTWKGRVYCVNSPLHAYGKHNSVMNPIVMYDTFLCVLDQSMNL